jgi:hypothetical protein
MGINMNDNSKQERTFYIIGSIFILIGILCNEWVLANLFSPDGVIAPSRRIVVWIFDFVIITIGLTIIIKRKSLQIKRLIYSIILLFIMIVSVEAGLQLTYFISHKGAKEEITDKRYLLPQYKGKEWARPLYEEMSKVSGEYKEYRGWGKKEFHGKYINIGSDGVRKTWNSTLQRKDPKTIYVFGGSTIWGDGVIDDNTIPSYISKKLDKSDCNSVVYNYGEWAYTYTQGIIHLLFLLRDGYRPDYVIFYDGIADIYGAYQSGVPGHLHYSYSLRNKFKENKISNLQHIMIGITNILKEYSRIYNELIKINRRLDPPQSMFQEVAHNYDDKELRELSRGIVEYYGKSLMLLDNLSKSYGFKYICFWQPVSFTGANITDEEIKSDVRFQDNSLIKLHKYTLEYIKTKSFPHFYNISDVFSDKTKSYYIDFAHITEEGNEVVADKIISLFEKEYLSNE